MLRYGIFSLGVGVDEACFQKVGLSLIRLATCLSSLIKVKRPLMMKMKRLFGRYVMSKATG